MASGDFAAVASPAPSRPQPVPGRAWPAPGPVSTVVPSLGRGAGSALLPKCRFQRPQERFELGQFGPLSGTQRMVRLGAMVTASAAFFALGIVAAADSS